MFKNRLNGVSGFRLLSRSSSVAQRLIIQHNISTISNAASRKRPNHELASLEESTSTLAVSMFLLSQDNYAEPPTFFLFFQFRSIPYGSPPELIFGASRSIQFNHSSPFFNIRILQTHPRPSTISRTLSLSSPTSRPTVPPTIHHTTSTDSLNPFLTKEEMRTRQIGLKKFKKGYTMDLTIMISKKKVHKSAVVREQCKRRFKEAIRLVVMKGAYVEEGLVKFDQDNEGPRKWLVGGKLSFLPFRSASTDRSFPYYSGFSYVASGTLELFRCDFPKLVEQVRTALRILKAS